MEKATSISNFLMLCIAELLMRLARNHATCEPSHTLALAALVCSMTILERIDLLCLLGPYVTADLAVVRAVHPLA